MWFCWGQIWLKICGTWRQKPIRFLSILVFIVFNLLFIVNFQKERVPNPLPEIIEKLTDFQNPPGTSDLHIISHFNTTEIAQNYRMNLDPFKDNWKLVNLDGIEVHVYSAFYDSRPYGSSLSKPSIRINGAIKRSAVSAAHSSKFQCLIESEEQDFFVSAREIQFELLKEHFSLPWGSCSIICDAQGVKDVKKMKKVYLLSSEDSQFHLPRVSLPIHTFPQEQELTKLGVCVKPFHFKFNRALWLVEFIEMYRLQGATQFLFYNHTVGPDVELVLQRYENMGLVTILQWNLQIKSQTQIRTEAMFTALGDCNLRAVGKFKYLAIVDLDEYIFPKSSKSLVDFLESKEKSKPNVAYFVFQNTFHYLYWPNYTTTMKEYWEKSDWSEVPYLLTQTKLTRVKQPNKHGVRSKYVTKPERVGHPGNHIVWKTIRGFKNHQILATEALSHHYRICEFGGYDCLDKPSINDPTALQWAPELIPNVKKACSNIFGETSCPKAPALGSPW